jgi:hypothetical protein
VALEIAVAGCQPEKEIRSYSVPKEVAAVAEAPQATHRMLTAIVPENDAAWFFKVVGPIADVDAAEDSIRSYLETVKLQDGNTPTWKLPEGWTEDEGSGLRSATIHIPTKGEPLELSVMTLPWPADGSALLENVNRWRGQLQLPPVGPVGLPTMVEKIDLDGTTATLVDLHGAWNASAAMPPFAARGMPNDEIHSQIPSADSPPAQASAPFQYKAPEGWQPLEATGIRKLAFQVADDDGQALLTVMSFPQAGGPAITSVAANVNRWQRELGMPEAAEDELSKSTTDIKVDGEDATLVELLPDQSSNLPEATLAAMIPRGQEIWFVKLKGSRKSVEAQREQFREFVESIDFAGGGADGN